MPTRKRRRREGPVVGLLRRRHKLGCEATDPIRGCQCPIELKGNIKGRQIHRSLGTTGWAEAQLKLKEIVIAAGAPPPGEQPARESLDVQRGYAKTLTRVDARERTVRIPRTAARASQLTYSKLLTRVDPDASTGYGFEGTVLKPGAILPIEALWPTPEHPKIPILLECAGALNPKSGHGRQSQDELWVLWRFHQGRHEWQEIARAVSSSWTWAIDLRPIAIRALEESSGKEVIVYGSAEKSIESLVQAVDRELKQLSPPDRGRLLASLHDQLKFRYVHFVLGRIDAFDSAGDVLELAPAGRLLPG